METILKALAHHWHLSAAQYWHLRLLFAISLVPTLALLYVVLFDKSTHFLAKFRAMGTQKSYPGRLFSSNYTASLDRGKA
jgi:hypothetical protein